VQGLTDRSRRPYRYANQLPFQVENSILNVKREHPRWGARKIRERLLRRFSGIPIPAKSPIHAVLDRHGLLQRRGRPRRRAEGTALSWGQRPNDLWCAGYKGEFLPGNRQYCYPLTVTDHASRYLLACEALSSTREGCTLGAYALAWNTLRAGWQARCRAAFRKQFPSPARSKPRSSRGVSERKLLEVDARRRDLQDAKIFGNGFHHRRRPANVVGGSTFLLDESAQEFT